MRRLLPERIDNVIGNCYPVILMARMNERIDGWMAKSSSSERSSQARTGFRGFNNLAIRFMIYFRMCNIIQRPEQGKNYKIAVIVRWGGRTNTEK